MPMTDERKKQFLERAKNNGYSGGKKKTPTRTDSTGKIEFGSDVSRQERLDFYDLNEEDYNKLADDMVEGRTTDEKYLESRDDLSPDVKRAGLGDIKYTDKEYFTDDYTNQVQNELDKLEQQTKSGLDRFETKIDFAKQQNNDYLQQQLQQFEEKKNQNLEQVNTLQNRRGGFYSGGVDYQRGQVMDATTDAKQQLSSEVGSQIAQLNAEYAQLAQEATQKLNQMRQQAPDKVRQLVQQAIQGDAEAARAEAEITGMYNGQQTLEARNKEAQLQIDQGVLDLKEQDQNFEEQVKKAALTGYLSDGTPTSDEQQRQLDNLWAMSEQTGVIHPQLAQMYGIPEGTPTQEAQQNMIQNNIDRARVLVSSRNANTSRMNANNNASNRNVDNLMDVWKATGEAPEGIPGVEPGSEYKPYENTQGNGNLQNLLGANLSGVEQRQMDAFYSDILPNIKDVNQARDILSNYATGDANQHMLAEMANAIGKKLEGNQTQLSQRDLEIFENQLTQENDLKSFSSEQIRRFVNQQYANGVLTEQEADEVEDFLVQKAQQSQQSQQTQSNQGNGGSGYGETFMTRTAEDAVRAGANVGEKLYNWISENFR